MESVNRDNADSGVVEWTIRVLQVRKKAQAEVQRLRKRELRWTRQKEQVISGDMEEMKKMMRTVMQAINELEEGQKQYEIREHKVFLLHTMEKEKIRNNVVITELCVDTENKAVIKEGAKTFIKEKMEITTKIKDLRKLSPKKPSWK
ncbi:hypothetical protein ILUMI_03518 [Ignelater luminosus]|uniref:Uncharacterized protein n=1 Tax=Ignelater luminosus TaxID=2038154 RepID=A0A8K0DLM2_IGNLU|nr:hypothetical protein ILUMI_03518 [Ignelater luminosus]